MKTVEKLLCKNVSMIEVEHKAFLAKHIKLVNARLSVGHVHAFDDFPHKLA
jgi:hypothetical protein